MSKITKFTIDRSTWYRGKGSDHSRLIIAKDTHPPSDEYLGKMCCLGHLGLACGVPKEEMENAAYPLSTGSELFPDELLVDYCSDGSEPLDGSLEAIVLINDDSTISNDLREAYLAKHFAAIGIEVEFIN